MQFKKVMIFCAVVGVPKPALCLFRLLGMIMHADDVVVFLTPVFGVKLDDREYCFNANTNSGVSFKKN